MEISLNGLSETGGHALLIKRETKSYHSEGPINKNFTRNVEISDHHYVFFP